MALIPSTALAVGAGTGAGALVPSSELSADTNDITYVRLDTAVQRVNGNPKAVADLAGKIYAEGTELGNTYTLVKVEYSGSQSGPWTEGTILSGDGEYSWPGTGSASGDAYKVPVQIQEYVLTQLFWRITVSY